MRHLKTSLVLSCLLTVSSVVNAQGGPRPSQLGASKLNLGEPGIAWYTTWETALAEAKRSGRPIMFVAAATQCHGVSGVFWPGYTATQNGLFASKDFIEASREFVCVRIDSYESEEHQEYVRTFLQGRFENSVFCLLAPNGTEWLTRGNRGPEMVLGRNAVERMNFFGALYPATADVRAALVADAHTVRQVLNVASADQRVLVLVNGSKQQLETARESLKAVVNDDRIIGRFHFDLEEGNEWRKSITGATDGPGIMLVNPGEFGLDGTVMQQLPLDTAASDIIKAMLAANETFAKTTKKKVYSEHVAKGSKLGIYFEGGVEYGEDRDGDGEIDRGGPGGRSRGPSDR